MAEPLTPEEMTALVGDVYTMSEINSDRVERVLENVSALETENARLREALERMARDEMRAGYLVTYMGGYRSPATIEAYRHGMETVFNGLAEYARRALGDPDHG